MRKLLSFVLAMLLLLGSFVGCQNTPVIDDNVDTEVTDTADSSETPAEATYDPIKEYDEEQVVVVDEATNTGFLIKSKKFPQSNNGTDTLILSVENCTEKNYTIRIKVEFFDAEGNRIRTRRKSFMGFPAGWQNFFIFLPEVNYETMSCTIDTTEYTEPTYAQHVLKNAVPVNLFITRTRVRTYPTYEILDNEYVAMLARYQIANISYDDVLYLAHERILFDNQGQVCDYFSLPQIIGVIDRGDEYLKYGPISNLEISDVLWKDREDYVWPENLTGELVGIFSVLGVSTEMQ